MPKIRKSKPRLPKSGPTTPAAPPIPPAAALAFRAASLAQTGDTKAAQELFRHAVAIDPHLAGAWLALGTEAMEGRRYTEANAHLLRAIAEAEYCLRLIPDDRPSHVARSMAYCSLFLPTETVESALRAIRLAPDPALHSNLLFFMNFLPSATPESVYAEAVRWNALHAAPLSPLIQPHTNSPDPGRRLKLGYVSPDLHSHAIMKFLPPVFEFHDRSQFDLIVYTLTRRSDMCTDILRGLVENLVPFHGSGSDLAARIRNDGIDILIDLAGHTMPWEYLRAFALKPAPIQASWLGVLSTTGMTAMDYYIGGPQMPCPGTEACFTEAVCRLPRAPYCYRPDTDEAVAPAPCLERGYVTFGSFNSPAKINPEVVRVWSEVLRAVPGSRLLVKYRTMDTEMMQDRFRSWFAREGIASDRLEFEGLSRSREYMGSFGGIDIALDPFPYQGGTTTLDTLYMGVPMVSMAGRLAVSRSGPSILGACGLGDMVAESPAGYVEAAVFLSSIVAKIPDLRRNVRQAFQSSAFMDEVGVTRDLEAAYREMWHRWCRSQSH